MKGQANGHQEGQRDRATAEPARMPGRAYAAQCVAAMVPSSEGAESKGKPQDREPMPRALPTRARWLHFQCAGNAMGGEEAYGSDGEALDDDIRCLERRERHGRRP